MATLLHNDWVTRKTISNIDTDIRFDLLINELSQINIKNCDKRFVNSCVRELSLLDYKAVGSVDERDINSKCNVVITKLCTMVLQDDTNLIKNICNFLSQLIVNDLKFHAKTSAICKRWILETLKFSLASAHEPIISLFSKLVTIEKFDDINQCLDVLLGTRGCLKQYLDPVPHNWYMINRTALSCLENIVSSSHNNSSTISENFAYIIKDIVFKIIFTGFESKQNPHAVSVLCSCLRILNNLLSKKLIPISDLIGEILGIVKFFLFVGIIDYDQLVPQALHPIVMHLPEQTHFTWKIRNSIKPRAKYKEQGAEKDIGEAEGDCCIGYLKAVQLEENLDTELDDVAVQKYTKLRLEAVRLLQTYAENSKSSEIFGYWPQIVATGSQKDARVLTRSVLKDSSLDVKQCVLSTLTKLIVNGKSFLIHAEESEHKSFTTCFGTVYLMIEELYYTLTLVLAEEENTQVLTHALKCVTALIQCTPYTRLKPKFITELMEICRLHIYSTGSVEVAALAIFETIVSCNPITPEMYAVLSRSIRISENVENAIYDLSCDTETKLENEEADVEDLKADTVKDPEEVQARVDQDINRLVLVCLTNISRKTKCTPTRVQSLKLLGKMALTTENLVFPNLSMIVDTLVNIRGDPETQVLLYVCRVLEIMAGCLTKNSYTGRALNFWNDIHECIILFLHHQQAILREAACNCLGNIGPTLFTISFDVHIKIMTGLNGAVRDDESAVRAAAMRALGMLVTLTDMDEKTDFLMDLAGLVCIAADDVNLGVRIKGAWALANLCDFLSRKRICQDSESLPLDILLPKLYRVSVKASKDNDKVKCNGARALGTIMYTCCQKYVLGDTSLGLQALIDCATLGNDMKVRWNACRALGLVLSCNADHILPPSWRDATIPALCDLICNSPNFKVRTNAAWALYSCDSYGKYVTLLWKSIIIAFENSKHVPSYAEYPHRDALIQQLCLTLSHVVACTRVSELQNLQAEIADHVEDISYYIQESQKTIVPEKIGDLIKAKSQLENYAKNAASVEDRKIAATLINIFGKTSTFENLHFTA